MSKPASIQINIPSPCSQSWDEMTPSGGGRFCDHCQKTVIDFTTWSDAALYNYFSKDDGHTCGRFLTTQINRAIHIPHQPHSRLYRMTIALGLTLLFAQTPQLLAQNRPPQTTQTNTDSMQQHAPTSLTGEIRGQVLDNKKEAIISAAIQVYQNGILKGGTVTDYDGNYIVKPLDAPASYDIQIIYIGYDSVKIQGVAVKPDQVTPVNATMLPSHGNIQTITYGWRKPLINPNTRPPRTITREEIANMPVTRVTDMISTVVGGSFNAGIKQSMNVAGSQQQLPLKQPSMPIPDVQPPRQVTYPEFILHLNHITDK